MPAYTEETTTVRVPTRAWDMVKDCAALDNRKLGAELTVLIEAGAEALGHLSVLRPKPGPNPRKNRGE